MLSLEQNLKALLCTREQLVDLRFDLVRKVGFVAPDGSFVDEKKYLCMSVEWTIMTA